MSKDSDQNTPSPITIEGDLVPRFVIQESPLRAVATGPAKPKGFNLLLEYRQMLGLSREKMAAKYAMSVDLYSRYESFSDPASPSIKRRNEHRLLSDMFKWYFDRLK